jgi:succinate dehydrogenase hydrophobic anchor subunit
MNITQAIRKAPLYFGALLIGAGVEVNNHHSLFYKVAAFQNPEFPNFANHGIGLIFALFFVSVIVGSGSNKQYFVSWGLAFLTSIVSFASYSALPLEWSNMNNIGSMHMAIINLSILVPILVAWLTHQIAKHIPNDDRNPALRVVEEAIATANHIHAITGIKTIVENTSTTNEPAQVVVQQTQPQPQRIEPPHRPTMFSRVNVIKAMGDNTEKK